MLGRRNAAPVIAIDVSQLAFAQNARMNPVPRDLPAIRRRLRRVMEHIGRSLRIGLDGMPDELSLKSLAAVACWSPEHLDRVYRLHVGEPPLVTVRRLRLRRAAEALLEGRRLADVAHGAGYASTQAFGRAFVRQFGELPTQWLRSEAALRLSRPAPTAIRVVHLAEAQPCHLLSYEGDSAGISEVFDQLIDRLQRCHSPRAQWQVFGIGDHAAEPRRVSRRTRIQAVALAQPLARPPEGLDHGRIGAGAYARLSTRHAGDLDERLREAGWQRTDVPSLLHYDTDPANTPPPERREWLYVPVARR